jgi:conjugal transfer pilus assembly protein TraF
MKMGYFKVFLILLSLSNAFAADQPWYHGKSEGWLWYKDSVEEKLLSPRDKASGIRSKQSRTNSDQVKSFKEQADDLNKAFEESTARAVLYPTLANVRHAQQMQQLIVDKAFIFQQMWMVAEAMDHPFKDSNRNPRQREIAEQFKQQQLTEKIKALNKNYGLFFFFSGRCKYCHEFAPIVKQFAEEYGFEIQAVSADEGTLPHFPKPLPDNGILSVVNPKGEFPMLVLANPKTQVIIPVARSLLNKDELLENFRYVISYLEKKS